MIIGLFLFVCECFSAGPGHARGAAPVGAAPLFSQPPRFPTFAQVDFSQYPYQLTEEEWHEKLSRGASRGEVTGMDMCAHARRVIFE